MPTSSNGCGGKNDVVPQPVRVWKRRAVDGLDIKILSVFRGPSYHQQDGATGILGECAEVTGYLHTLLTQQLCGILCGGSAI